MCCNKCRSNCSRCGCNNSSNNGCGCNNNHCEERLRILERKVEKIEESFECFSKFNSRNNDCNRRCND